MFEHGGDERLEHPAGAADPEVRDAGVRGGDGRVIGPEAGGVVVGSEQRGQVGQELLRAVAPGLAGDGIGCGAIDARGHRTAARKAGAPDGAVTVDLEARITGATALRGQGMPGTDRPGKADRALKHGENPRAVR